MSDGPLHDELMSLGRDLASQGAISGAQDIMLPQSSVFAPDPFSGVYNDDYARRYGAQIHANAMVNAQAFAERARTDSLRRSSGDLISDAAAGVGWVAGSALGGATTFGAGTMVGGLGGAMAGGMITEELLKGFGFYDTDPLISLNEQAQGMVDDSVHRLAWAAGGLGLDRGVSLDAARDIGGGLTDIAKDAGLHGVEASRIMSSLEPYAGALQLSNDPGALADQLESYMEGVIDLVQRTNTSMERATELIAQGAIMGVSPGNAGAMYEGIYNYSGMAGMDPNAVLSAGVQNAAPFAGTGFGTGSILSSTAATMGAAALSNMGSSNIPLWAAAGGASGLGSHMASIGSSFASNPMMWGRMMGSGSFNDDAWQTILSGGALSDDFGDSYSDMSANDRLVSQYQGMQEMMFRPNDWSRAAMGSIMGSFAEDGITDPEAISMGLVHHGYAPNIGTARLMGSEYRKMSSPTYDVGRSMSALYDASATGASNEINRMDSILTIGVAASSIQGDGNPTLSERIRMNLGLTSRDVISNSINYAEEQWDTEIDRSDPNRVADALAMYSASQRESSEVNNISVQGDIATMRALQVSSGNVLTSDAIGYWREQIGEENFAELRSRGIITRGGQQGWGGSPHGRDTSGLDTATVGGQMDSGVDMISSALSYAQYGIRTAWDAGSASPTEALGVWTEDYWKNFATGGTVLNAMSGGWVRNLAEWGGFIDSRPITDPSRDTWVVDQEGYSEFQQEYLEERMSNVGNPSQFIPGYRGASGLPLSPMMDYAMRNNLQDGFAAPRQTDQKEWGSVFAAALSNFTRAESMYDSDQVDARLNLYQPSSGFDSGWNEFLGQVSDNEATFRRSSGESLSHSYDRFVQDIYGEGHVATSRQSDYINTYIGMTNSDFSKDSSSAWDTMNDLSIMERDQDQYQEMMDRVSGGTGLSSEAVSELALYGHYRTRLASGDFESDAEEARIRNAVNDMQQGEPTLQRLFATTYGSVANLAGTEGNLLYLASSGTLDERAAITEGVWNRASSYASDLTGGMSYNRLINMSPEEAEERFSHLTSTQLSAYGGNFAEIVRKLKAGEDVTSSDIMSLQEFADFHNPDTEQGEPPVVRDGNDEATATWTQLTTSTMNILGGIIKTGTPYVAPEVKTGETVGPGGVR